MKRQLAELSWVVAVALPVYDKAGLKQGSQASSQAAPVLPWGQQSALPREGLYNSSILVLQQKHSDFVVLGSAKVLESRNTN